MQLQLVLAWQTNSNPSAPPSLFLHCYTKIVIHENFQKFTYQAETVEILGIILSCRNL